MPRTSLADILIDTGDLTPEQLTRAEALSTERQLPLSEVLLRQHMVSDDVLLRAQGRQLGVTYWAELPDAEFDVTLMHRVPLAFARQHGLVPIRMQDGTALVAISRALDLQPLDDVSLLLKAPVEPVLSSEREIIGALNRFYDTGSQTADKVIQNLDDEALGRLAHDLEGPQDILDHEAEAPIIQLVNLILSQAVRDRASDIHVEPFERALKVRYRIDGVLHEVLSPPKALQPRITSRLKVMADLNIAETRLPQDGRIAIRVRNREIDIRVSVVPTAFGERLVLRLLDKSGALFELEEIGLSPELLPVYERLIHRSHGIILVTGPTGSGKSTTLAALIDRINAERRGHILTIEDPIEYIHSHRRSIVNQREVHGDTAGFAPALRAALREDPDVVLIGEMRDLETTEAALRLAETGHLTLATLHTSSAVHAIGRVIDLFPAHQQPQVRTQLSLVLEGVVCQALVPVAGGPGRVCAVEVLVATPAIRNLIREDKAHLIYAAMQAGQRQRGMQTMTQALAALHRQGRITQEQALDHAANREELEVLMARRRDERGRQSPGGTSR